MHRFSDRKDAAWLARLRPQLAAAAQPVYDAWEQDDDGESDEYGYGGICDDIASAMVSVLDAAGIEACTHHDESENHTAVYAKLDDGIYYIDIPMRTYETGSFYNYKKIHDVAFDADDVVIDRVFGARELHRWQDIVES